MADTWTPVRPSGRRGSSPEPASRPLRVAAAESSAPTWALRRTAAPSAPTLLMKSRRVGSGGASVAIRSLHCGGYALPAGCEGFLLAARRADERTFAAGVAAMRSRGDRPATHRRVPADRAGCARANVDRRALTPSAGGGERPAGRHTRGHIRPDQRGHDGELLDGLRGYASLPHLLRRSAHLLDELQGGNPRSLPARHSPAMKGPNGGRCTT